jgi:hypothetical protein
VGPAGGEHPCRDEPEQFAHDFAENLRCGLGEDADVQADDVDLVLVDQVPVGDRGLACGKAVDDDPAGDAFGRGQAGSLAGSPTAI